jgi:hypothetical protein
MSSRRRDNADVKVRLLTLEVNHQSQDANQGQLDTGNSPRPGSDAGGSRASSASVAPGRSTPMYPPCLTLSELDDLTGDEPVFEVWGAKGTLKVRIHSVSLFQLLVYALFRGVYLPF